MNCKNFRRLIALVPLTMLASCSLLTKPQPVTSAPLTAYLKTASDKAFELADSGDPLTDARTALAVCAANYAQVRKQLIAVAQVCELATGAKKE